MLLAIDYRTIIFVSRVANSPSSFIRFSLMIWSIFAKILIPSTSSRAYLFKTLKHSTNWL